MDEFLEECAICMNLLHEKTLVKTCRHSFCYECICKWAKSKRICPLCNASFTTLVIAAQNREEEVSAPTVLLNEPDMRRDLEALDEHYFIEEVGRLLIITENAQRTMARSRSKYNVQTQFGSRADTWEERNWELLEDTVSRLKYYKELFNSEEMFEPFSTLQEMHTIQENVRVIFGSPLQQTSEELKKVTRYSADDVDEISSDEEEIPSSYEYNSEYGRGVGGKGNGNGKKMSNKGKQVLTTKKLTKRE